MSRFPGCPLRGFQPSGSYPRATHNAYHRPLRFSGSGGAGKVGNVPVSFLGGHFDIFFFFLLGGGEGEWGSPRRQEGAGVVFLLKFPEGGGGGFCQEREGGEGPGGCLRGILGGGPKYIFSGSKIRTKFPLFSPFVFQSDQRLA